MTSQHVVNVTRRWLDQLPDGTPLTTAPPIKLENGDHKRVLDAVRRSAPRAEGQAQGRCTSGQAPHRGSRPHSPRRGWPGAPSAQNVVVQIAGPGPLRGDLDQGACARPSTAASPTPSASLCKLFPEQMHAVLLAGAGAAPGQDGALSAAEREARISRADRQAPWRPRRAKRHWFRRCSTSATTPSARRRDVTPSRGASAVGSAPRRSGRPSPPNLICR